MKSRVPCLPLFSILLASILAGTASGSSDNPRETPVVVAVRKVGPAVVNISTERVITVRNDPFSGYGGVFDRGYPLGTRKYRTTSLGSGVIIDDAGYVLTNDHVVSKASKVIVTLADGQEYAGTILSTYPQKDLAIVKIDSNKPFPHVKLGDSDDLMIGETMIAVGNPYGLSNTVTTGVLSARNRSIESEGKVVFDNFLQTDAAINPGNSGGALLDINGELIGVNTAIFSQAEGIGFAIPINTVKQVLEILLDTRKVKKTWFGLELKTIDEGFAAEKGLKYAKGLYVTGIDEGSPAEEAGLKEGDIVLGIDGRNVDCVYCYDLIALAKNVGDKATIQYLRGSGKRDAELVVTQLPKPSPHDLAVEKLGLDLSAIPADVAKKLRIDVEDGLLVTRIVKKGPADSKGIEAGDVIVQLGEYRVRSLDDAAIILDKIQPGDNVALSFIRGEYIIRTRLTSN